jgi:hypothetical protein
VPAYASNRSRICGVFAAHFTLELMIDLPSVLNIASIAAGFVAAVCFCIGAITMSPKTIASASATIAGGNPTLMRSLSEQRAQYIVGAAFLVFSFSLQAAVLLFPKDTPPPPPLSIQSPLALLGTTLILAGVIAYLSVRYATAMSNRASEQELENEDR